MPRQFFHYLCIALLLVAQQGALVHAAWHASGGAQAHAGQAPHDLDQGSPASQDKQDNLCAFDLAFGQMLGGVHASCGLPLAIEITAQVAVVRHHPRLLSEAIPAQSRGPPQYL